MAAIFVGRVIPPRCRDPKWVRIVTDGSAPTDADSAEEIPDPFDDAGRDVRRWVSTLESPAQHRLGDVTLAPPVRPRKIICVGRNYRAHAEEMGNEVPAEPLLFTKPSSALLPSGGRIVRPSGYERVDMEAELVAVIGRPGRRIDHASALQHVAGYTLGNDVSCRDLQRREKQWTRAKGFDTFAPLGPFVRLWPPGQPLPDDACVEGYLDEERKQCAPLSAMIFDIPTVIAFVTHAMTLEPGDLIYTGTPAGVSPLSPGQVAEVHLEGVELGRLSNPVVGED